jgi:hypothetical protein
VSTGGLDEARVRQYIREQDERENRQGELDLGEHVTPQRGDPDIQPPTGATTRKWPPWGDLPDTTASPWIIILQWRPRLLNGLD